MPNRFARLKHLFRVRNLMRVAFFILALITLWAVFCLEERWRGERLWNNYRTAAAARGVKLDMEQVVPPAVPDAENFAAIPMIRELFAAQDKGGTVPQWFKAARLSETTGKLGPGPNGEPMLDQWRDDFVKLGIVQPPATDSAAAVLSALQLIEPELKQLREAARRPSTKFPVPWDRGISAILPHLGPMQQTTKVFRLAMTAHLEKRNTDEALECFHDGLRIYTALLSEPALISGLVRISILRIIEDGLVDRGALTKWSDAELEEITSSLSKVDLTADFDFAIQSERALINTAFDDLVSKSNLELAQVGDFIGLGKQRSTVSLYPRGWFRLSQVKMNERFDRSIDRALDVTVELPEDPLLRSDRSYFAKLPYLLYLATAPVLDSLPKRYVHARTSHEFILAACALEKYRRKHNAYPDNLSALVPSFATRVPADPMDGAPIRYRKLDDGGFSVWSIGINRIDDGGKLEPQKPAMSQADWVLQVPGKP
jgi:hypothetical protein